MTYNFRGSVTMAKVNGPGFSATRLLDVAGRAELLLKTAQLPGGQSVGV